MRPASTARAAVLAACAAGCGLRPGRAYHVAPAVVEGPRLRSTPLDRWERAEEAPAPALGTAREDVDRAAPAIRRLRNGVPVYVLARHDFPAATVVFGVRLRRRVPPAVAAMYASAAAYPLGDWAWMIEPANGASRQIHVSPDAVMLDVTALAPSILDRSRHCFPPS